MARRVTDALIPRRAFLEGAALGTLLSSLRTLGASPVRCPAPARAFVDAWREIAERSRASARFDEAAYALDVRRALLDLDVEAWRNVPRSPRAVDGIRRTVLWSNGPLALEELVFEPRAQLTPRVDGSRLTISRAAAGLVRFERFEAVGDVPDPDDTTSVFVVQRTRAGLLDGARPSHATFPRATLRTLRAGHDGATLFDVVTTLAPRPRRVVEADIAHTAHDALDELHAARWMPPAQ